MMDKKLKTRAMIDMAAAFGHGARRTATPLKWEAEAVEKAQDWMQDRLDKTDKNYWKDADVRSDACQRAFEIGLLLAHEAKDGVITGAAMEAALKGFGIRKRPRPLDYCPF